MEIVRRLKQRNEHPAAIIRSLDYDQCLPVDVLILLLREVDARLRLVSREERRKAMLDQPMTGHLLKGIWSHGNIWRSLLTVFEARDVLCLQAVVEGFDHYILDWASATVPPVEMAALREHGWRVALVRSLTMAHLATAPRCSADGALRMFLTFHDRREEAKRKLQQPLSADQRKALIGLVEPSPRPAMVALGKSLTGGGFENTSEEL